MSELLATIPQRPMRKEKFSGTLQTEKRKENLRLKRIIISTRREHS